MRDRSLVTLMASGLRRKAAVTPTTFDGPLRELSGVGVKEPFAGAWQRNMSSENSGTLLSNPAVYACVTRIASDIAKLDLRLLDETLPQVEPAAAASPFWRCIRKPNGHQNRIQFIRYWLLCKLIWGNAYAVKMRDARTMVSALYLLDPRRVAPMVSPDGGVYYSLGADDLAQLPHGILAAPQSEVIHDRCPTLWHPLIGVPPLFAAALSGSLGIKIQRNSHAFFSNMSRPSGILTAPRKISDEVADRLKRQWEENFSAGSLGKFAVLGEGLEYQAMTIAAEQSQVAEQLEISARDIATAFHMPAHKINIGAMPAAANAQAAKIGYYEDCLQEHIEDIELCLTEGLELPPGLTYEFDLDGLTRMDSLTQMDVLTKGTKGGILKPNEGRRRLRLGPVDGGDAVYMQHQDYSLAALAKRDAKEDPFASGTAPAAPPPKDPEDPEAEGVPGDDVDETDEPAADAEKRERAADTLLQVLDVLAAKAAAAAPVPVPTPAPPVLQRAADEPSVEDLLSIFRAKAAAHG